MPLGVLVTAAVVAVAVHAIRSPDGTARHHTVSENKTAALPVQPTRLLTPRLVRLVITKARSYWGGTLCDGGIAFRFRPLPDSLVAEASWETFPDAERQYLHCFVTFDANPTRIKTTFLRFCGAVIHEYGHLSGHSHVTDPTDIMNPLLTKRNLPRTCLQVAS